MNAKECTRNEYEEKPMTRRQQQKKNVKELTFSFRFGFDFLPLVCWETRSDGCDACENVFHFVPNKIKSPAESGARPSFKWFVIVALWCTLTFSSLLLFASIASSHGIFEIHLESNLQTENGFHGWESREEKRILFPNWTDKLIYKRIKWKGKIRENETHTCPYGRDRNVISKHKMNRNENERKES